MKIKLSEIFIPLNGKQDYSIDELSFLSLQPDFIERTSSRLDLSYLEQPALEGGLCFAESNGVRPEFRSTFGKKDILEIVTLQMHSSQVNLEKDKVHFPQNSQEFFSKALREILRIKCEKQRLRNTMLEQRDKLPRKDLKVYSENICQQLWALIEQKNLRTIHSYLPMGSEVNTIPLLQKALDKGLTVVVPKTLRKRKMQNLVLKDLKNMELGIFNTYHPKEASEYKGEYDLIIVAGLLFDRRGFRVGYGGGYYDTFLANQKHALKVGVCYPFQTTESVPIEAHDIRLDLFLS
ncbi:5-formyltetrahydrofolate cyclo-ligase [Roseivirga sp. UBA1976]|uniref:5-formyltetrahydrofolate cyclo-ligase n=1 Tax=Roseivirga sp. UBA1976 TaxID=1947386 RepID=UPI00257D5520|nr:5-formyltetrahydrofolate cyclo-ligase [Roseivirga sp. UBA1976]|tara:strand:- start:4368 stop:5246 length:879 start_codon:yes stop_codon:yes gene_type:complete